MQVGIFVTFFSQMAVANITIVAPDCSLMHMRVKYVSAINLPI